MRHLAHQVRREPRQIVWLRPAEVIDLDACLPRYVEPKI